MNAKHCGLVSGKESMPVVQKSDMAHLCVQLITWLLSHVEMSMRNAVQGVLTQFKCKDGPLGNWCCQCHRTSIFGVYI